MVSNTTVCAATRDDPTGKNYAARDVTCFVPRFSYYFMRKLRRHQHHRHRRRRRCWFDREPCLRSSSRIDASSSARATSIKRKKCAISSARGYAIELALVHTLHISHSYQPARTDFLFWKDRREPRSLSFSPFVSLSVSPFSRYLYILLPLFVDRLLSASSVEAYFAHAAPETAPTPRDYRSGMAVYTSPCSSPSFFRSNEENLHPRERK